jgi:hypothetical protein
VPIAKNDFERCTVACLRYYQVYSSVVQLRIRMQPKRLFSHAVLYRQVHELLRGIGDCQIVLFFIFAKCPFQKNQKQFKNGALSSWEKIRG